MSEMGPQRTGVERPGVGRDFGLCSGETVRREPWGGSELRETQGR